MNITDNRYIKIAKKLLSEKANVKAITDNRYTYGDIKKLVAEIGSINAQTARKMMRVRAHAGFMHYLKYIWLYQKSEKKSRLKT
mgnify:FL=1